MEALVEFEPEPIKPIFAQNLNITRNYCNIVPIRHPLGRKPFAKELPCRNALAIILSYFAHDEQAYYFM